MFVLSDRKNFSDPDHLSQTLLVDSIDPLTLDLDGVIDKKRFIASLYRKKVVILVHGYNCEFGEALRAYRRIERKIAPAYDVVLGYLWPGGNQGFDYFHAKARVIRSLSTRFSRLLQNISDIAQSVDIITHSMGSLLTLESLGKKEGLVRNLFLMGSAVDNESLERTEKYASAVDQCKQVYVYYSRNDNTLGSYYRLGELSSALGFMGSKHPDRLPAHIEQLDVSLGVASHSDYKNSYFVFDHVVSVADLAKPPLVTN